MASAVASAASRPAAAPAAAASTPAAASKKDPMLKLAAGCVAGSLEATATWPLEYIKTQMQTKRKVPVKGGFVSVPQPYTSIVAGLRYTVRTTGALSLFTGLTPTLLLSAPKAGIRFGTNQQLRSALTAEPSAKPYPNP
tara:strand:- start:330 stop:746 length:417 start_codon:yes stop_codon:yes gene_type:complete